MLTDNLKLFLHVLGWTTLRYIPAIDPYSTLCCGKDMVMFDEHDQEEDHSEQGGHLKSYVLCAGQYLLSTFQPRRETQLFDLLRWLSSPFKSLYAVRRPTAADQSRVQVQPGITDRQLH